MKIMIGFVCCFAIGIPVTCHAQGDEDSRRTWNVWNAFYPEGSVNWNRFLENGNVVKSLELTKEQRQSLRKLRDKIGKSLIGKQANADITDKQLKLEANQEIKNQLRRILLPFQVELLENIAIQHAFSTGIVSKTIGRILRSEGVISEKRLGEITSRALKVERDTEAEVTRLRIQAWNDILAELKTEQRKAIVSGLN